MQIALVTGASKGLGLATARALAKAGWSLVIDARGVDDLTAAANELAELTTVRSIVGDVADETHRERLIAAAKELGGLDLLVNNASTLGTSPLPPLADYSIEALRHVYEVNVLAPLALAQLALPLLRKSHGTIVNVTSDAAVEPYEGWGGYGSSKAALEQWSRVLAAEEPEIRVYEWDPGDMRTQMHQDAFPGEDISDRPEPETVVPALLHLLHAAPESGRYRAAEFAVVAA